MVVLAGGAVAAAGGAGTGVAGTAVILTTSVTAVSVLTTAGAVCAESLSSSPPHRLLRSRFGRGRPGTDPIKQFKVGKFES